MGFENFAIILRRIGATSSTRKLLVTAAIALAAVAFSDMAAARQARPLSQPATSNVKPTRALSSASQPDKHVLIQLTAPAAVTAYAAKLTSAGAPASNAVAISAGRNQIAANKAQQETLVSAMQAAGISYKEIYRVQRAMNGIAVIVPAAQVAALSKLPNVKSVRRIVPAYPSSNSSASFVGANQVWQGIPSAQADGTGIRIGIIDTGIDYQHANFGGSGLLSDYQKNDRITLANSVFPTPKVVGGTDLAGDDYDANGDVGSTTPTPDPNPTDCAGHGSHVAGIAAGFGVNSSGGTYSGPFDTASLSTLRIQPGIAHKALLYSIRVFGCGGSTDLVVPAIDYALDPNGDGDLSDHLDVINMSLGSDVGDSSSIDSEASEAASLSGMIVVAAAGNAGDTYMVVSSPSVSARTISVAASWDGGETAANVNITAPASIVGTYFGVPASFGPPLPGSALTGNLVYALPHDACNPLTNAAAIAGNIAVIDRGTCSFEPKVAAAQAAGAAAVIMVDNRPEVPITMGPDGVTPNPTIPSVMISQADGALIEAKLGSTVTGSITGVPGGDLMASFSSRGPDNGTPISLKPNITAPGVNIVSTGTGMTCVTGGACETPTASGFNPGNLPATLSGTSMATPQVAGLMALLRQLHPTLPVEELKALAMNGSVHDLTTSTAGAGFRYGAGRAGAGRIDAVASANLSVAAFSADGSGTVGVTFPSPIEASTTATQKVRVKNYSGTPASFTLAIDTVVDNPGVSFSLPGGTALTLLGHQTIDVDVRMTGSANLLTHTFDPTIFLAQGSTVGTQPRYWQTEETAYLTLTSGGTLLRVPLYVAPNPTSAMTGGASVPTGGLPTGAATINLTGTGVCTGTVVAGPTCAGNFPIDEESLVTPFELQVNNPRNLTTAPEHNVHYAGVSASVDNDIISFGTSLWGVSATVPGLTSDTEVTLVDGGGAPLFTLFGFVAFDPTGTDPTNVYLTGVFDYSAGVTNLYFFPNVAGPNQIDTRIFQNDVSFMSAPLDALGLTAGSTIHYFVDTFDRDGNNPDHLGPFTFNIGAPGLDFGGAILLDDLPGAKIPVAFNVANLTANGSLGAMLMHHHNKVGATAEVLTVSMPTPVSQGAVSRKVHGAAGTFDLPLSTVTTNPTTEPRQGPVQTIVFTFDKPIAGATVTVPEGTAIAGAPTFSGNDVVVALTGVTNAQYVTVTLAAVTAMDGGTGGAASARIGFLAADVNQNRVVTVADVGLVNGQLAQAVTAANYLKDINASGTLTVADKAIANANQTTSLPAP
jgi:subtilisin family serine protease